MAGVAGEALPAPNRSDDGLSAAAVGNSGLNDAYPYLAPRSRNLASENSATRIRIVEKDRNRLGKRVVNAA
jgi:hypothetical protein